MLATLYWWKMERIWSAACSAWLAIKSALKAFNKSVFSAICKTTKHYQIHEWNHGCIIVKHRQQSRVESAAAHYFETRWFLRLFGSQKVEISFGFRMENVKCEFVDLNNFTRSIERISCLIKESTTKRDHCDFSRVYCEFVVYKMWTCIDIIELEWIESSRLLLFILSWIDR